MKPVGTAVIAPERAIEKQIIELLGRLGIIAISLGKGSTDIIGADPRQGGRCICVCAELKREDGHVSAADWDAAGALVIRAATTVAKVRDEVLKARGEWRKR